MKKIFMIFFVFIFVCQSFIFSQNLNDFLLKYKNNQQKIQSLVSAGTLSVTLKNSEGTVINQTSNDMVIYMKYPDLFKIHMSGEFEMILVQKGDVVNQKIGANPVVTSKATETGNLMKSYFAIDIDESFDTSQVIRQNNFTDGEETYTIFELQYNQEINTKQTKIAAINKGDFYFNILHS